MQVQNFTVMIRYFYLERVEQVVLLQFISPKSIGKMMAGDYKRVLLIATGALLSPLSFQQGDTIPCIAHAVELTMK